MKSLLEMNSRSQSGFSLIEALIAVLVLATGLLALTALQGALIRSSADAKARSLIVAYAQSELERLRLGGVPAVQDQANLSSMADAELGQLAQDAGVGALTQSVNVSQWVADASGVFTENADESGAAPSDPYFRDVTINLTWTDAAGESRALSMSTSMSPLALTQDDVLVDRGPPDDAGRRPVVRREFALSEGMIPLAMGDGQDTAATNPKPLLVGRNDDTLVSDTRFDVLTYNLGDNRGFDGFARFNKRIETAVIGCRCQFGTDGFPTNGNEAAVNTFLKSAVYRPAYWDGDRYKDPVRVSSAATSSPATGAVQSEFCDVCCRDHKDAGYAAGPRFRPWPDQVSANPNHQHFLPDASGTLQAVTSGEYVESCRIIRVNGMWRVTSDPRLEDLAMLPTDVYPPSPAQTIGVVVNSSVATSPLASAAGKSSYTDFLYDFVNSRFNTTAGNNELTDSDRDEKHQSAGLNNPLYVPLARSTTSPVFNDKRWLHARGVMLDYLESADALKKVQDAYRECDATTTIGRAQCVLPYAPLAAINVTEIADWQGHVDALRETTPSASSFPGTSINYGRARMRRYSSAVALYPPVSPDDASNTLFDEQTVALLLRVRTGNWLAVSSTNGVIFGDATNPTRGVATVQGGIRFNVSWIGLETASDRDKNNDPLLYVIPDQANLASEIACDGDPGNRSSNPYLCSSENNSNVMLALGRFNRMIPGTGKATMSVCGVTQKVDTRATCQAYSLTSVQVGSSTYTPADVSYALVEGATGRTTEKRTLVLPSVADVPANNSNVSLNLSPLTPTEATAVCNGPAFAAWTCD